MRSMPSTASTAATVSENALDWALAQFERDGDTDIFPVPFEYAAIRGDWSAIKNYLSGQDLRQWTTRPIRRCLSPKHRFGFRISTQLDPLDALLFAGAVYEIGSALEARRVPIGRGIVHSYRFRPTVEGQLFDPAVGYQSFLLACRTRIADSNVKFVVTADIADFFPRLYSHPLENALAVAVPGRPDIVQGIKRLLGQWNFSVSYGIPVGPSASRLLSELAIADIDDALLAEGKQFVRYSDDYRVFCATERDAYQSLAFLATVLLENHGLTLQQHKTEIMKVDAFEGRYLASERASESSALEGRFYELLDSLGIESMNRWYEPIIYDDLSEDQQRDVDAMNLSEMLREQVEGDEEPNWSIVRFVLARLRQLSDRSGVDIVLTHADALYPAFRNVIDYLMDVPATDDAERAGWGARLLNMLDSSICGHLEYHRMLILNLFGATNRWGNADRLAQIFNRVQDPFTKRECILALGRAGQAHWFKTRKRSVMEFDEWSRRAFLAAASCLPGDEATHWYRSVNARLDPLEKAVAKWAERNRFA